MADYDRFFTVGAAARRTASPSVGKLFKSPYLIRSPETPADLSDIGNGHDAVIENSIDELIGELPATPSASAADPFETPFLDE